MSDFVIEDAREQILPIFLVDTQENGVFFHSRIFLGTAFFVSKRGDAITASHVLPIPAEIGEGKRLVAIVQRDGVSQPCWVTKAAIFPGCDLALVQINLTDTKYLPISDEEVLPGTDVSLIGIPNHEVWNGGKEMRFLKGYVSMSSKVLELNIALPKGMSGAPMFCGTKVAGFATGTFKSEELDESYQEVEQISDTKERIVISKTVSVTHYGHTYPFSKLRGIKTPVLDGMTFMEFIQSRNV